MCIGRLSFSPGKTLHHEEFCCMKWSWRLFCGYWLVAGIVLYWVSSEFLTHVMLSQLILNLLSSQEYIHRLYHWKEWLPSLCDQDPEMCWLSAGRRDHRLIGGSWISLISRQECVPSHRLVSSGVWEDLLREQSPSFLPGQWLSSLPSQALIVTSVVFL